MNREDYTGREVVALETIQSKIYEIRGVKVMLDFDLAKLYGVETKRLKEAVKRNIKRFPGDFMFILNNQEFINLRSQIATSSWGGSRYMPYAFTEQGVAMLSSVLRSDIAIEVNISIMRAFVAIRNILYSRESSNLRIDQLEKDVAHLKEYIEEVFTDYNDINEDTRTQLELINMTLAALQADKLQPAKERPKIGFKR